MLEDYIIIADAGGTKTKWCIIECSTRKTVFYTTSAVNATVTPYKDIFASISSLKEYLQSLYIDIDSKYLKIRFYGAGCNSHEPCKRIKDAFKDVFPKESYNIRIDSDIVASAEALFGKEKGIACILGTGSASCRYDGKRIVDSVPSLGYILGDEGSGAYFGKSLLNAFYKRDLPERICKELEKERNMKIPFILENIYRSDNPNAFLASFTPFLKRNEDDEFIKGLLYEGVKLFFLKNVLKYKPEPRISVRFIGGIAMAFQNKITEVASSFNLTADKFLNDPIEELGKKYLNNEID